MNALIEINGQGHRENSQTEKQYAANFLRGDRKKQASQWRQITQTWRLFRDRKRNLRRLKNFPKAIHLGQLCKRYLHLLNMLNQSLSLIITDQIFNLHIKLYLGHQAWKPRNQVISVGDTRQKHVILSFWAEKKKMIEVICDSVLKSKSPFFSRIKRQMDKWYNLPKLRNGQAKRTNWKWLGSWEHMSNLTVEFFQNSLMHWKLGELSSFPLYFCL